MSLYSRSLFVAALAAVAACGGKKPPEQPAPAPAPAAQPDDQAARDKARADSIEAARRAQAERDKAAADAAAKAAALKASLTQDLTAMIHFDFDKSDIKVDDESNLNRKASILATNSAVHVRVSGHCDERGSDEYNLALGNRRAASAKRYLVGKGVDGSRIETVSFGEERPVDPGHDETAWAKNRRDEFDLTAGADNLVAPR
jgi:peptidoglycan-associated lipoprotein